MISVDVEKLNKITNEVNPHIDSYEETLMNLFSKLKDATTDWYDPVSVAFDEAMITENNDSQNFFSEVKLRRDIIPYTSDLYSNLGRKINCDFNNKEYLINTLNNCISECTSIINEFNRIDSSFYYSEYYIILNQKTKVVDARAKLRKLKEKLTGKFQKIAEYEEDISSKIDELEPFKVMEFDTNYANNTELRPTAESYVYTDLLMSDINNIDLYKNEENKDLKSIFSGFNRISEGYVSGNVSKYKNDCDELGKNIEILEKNRDKYILELEAQITKYEGTTLITKEIFKEKDKAEKEEKVGKEEKSEEKNGEE